MAGSDNYYLQNGYTPRYKVTAFTAAGTLAIWTPTTSARVILTDLVISSNLGGTISIYTSFSSSSVGSRLFSFFMGGSQTIAPVFSAIESTTIDGSLWANISSGGSTESFVITATGFESGF